MSRSRPSTRRTTTLLALFAAFAAFGGAFVGAISPASAQHVGAWANVDDFPVVDDARGRVAPDTRQAPVVVIRDTTSPYYAPDPSVRFPPHGPQPPQPPVVYVPYVPPGPPVVYLPPQPPQPPVVQQVPAAATNLIVNGGFEQTALLPGSWQNVPAIAGWFTTFGTGFEIQAGVAGTPFEGRALIELDGDAPTGIAQDVAVAPGARYELCLAFSARPATTADDNRIAIYFDGQRIGRLEASGTNDADTHWQTATFVVSARTNRARLEIRDEGTANSLGSYVDDVRLTPAR